MILVIKLSGKVLEETAHRQALCRQVGRLSQDGHHLLIVHGGGKQLNELSARLGIPVIQHQGRRVTDEATIELATMVFSGINRHLVAGLVALNVRAVGMSAFDGQLTRCHKRAPIPVTIGTRTEMIDFGLVGEIEYIDAPLVTRMWDDGLLPVVSCLGADENGQILNINADTLAAELSIVLGADRLVSVSDVEGLYLDPQDRSTLLSDLTADQAREYLGTGRFTDGMVPKVEAALKVLDRGVACVQIVGGFGANSLLDGVAGKCGTLLRA